MYHNIPMELREFHQWVCWRYEVVGGRRTKVPYTVDGRYRANVNNPATWGSFNDACNTALTATMDGIGFVLTERDPYTGIDIDDKEENPASEAERVVHRNVLNVFQSYTERSVGGRGYHIIIRGKVQGGRDRGHIGVYSTQRYLTFSGDVVRAAPIGNFQEELEALYALMPEQGAGHVAELHDAEAVMTDRELFEMAMEAANGEKFDQLCRGEVLYRKDGYKDSPYESQSEADLALLSILAYYSRDNEQVRRLFRSSALGKREKAIRDNVYIDRTLRKIRAHQAAPVDYAQAQANAAAILASAAPVPALVDDRTFDTPQQAAAYAQAALAAAPDQSLPTPPAPEPAPPTPVHAPTHGTYTRPPGLVGELADYFYSTAIRPTPEAALAAAIGIVAGVAGRSYNISGTGLNQYILFLAKTGTGKEMMAKGIAKLISYTRPLVPMVSDFVGPSAFASGQGLIRVLDAKPCFVSIMGEFGLTLQALSDPRAPAAQLILRKVLLDLYSKSGWDDMLHSTAYSDSEKNTKLVHAPSVTILGESTPETFYDALDTGDIADGLIPRFHIIEYKGQRPDKNEQAGHAPDGGLVQRFADLAVVAVTAMNNHACAAVQLSPDGLELLNTFDRLCDKHMRASHHSGEVQLWNRAHLKALKLAGLLAVGCNPHNPVVNAEIAEWAITFTRMGTEQVLRRFQIGDVGIGEAKQVSELRRVINDYFTMNPKQLSGYNVDVAMQKAGIIPYSYIQIRLARVACFYKDRQGSTRALKSALDGMVAAEQLGQLTPIEAQNKFNKRQALYYVGPTYNTGGIN